eukprot:s1357_g1.t2
MHSVPWLWLLHTVLGATLEEPMAPMEMAQQVAQSIAGGDACVAAEPVSSGSSDLVECCKADSAGNRHLDDGGCWPRLENRSSSIQSCCTELLSALIFKAYSLIQEMQFLASASLALWLQKTFGQLERRKMMPIVQEAMLKHKDAIHQRAFGAVDWPTLGQHHFQISSHEANESLGAVVARKGSKDYALMAAWGSALLGLNDEASDDSEVSLICNVSLEVEALKPEQLKHFEHFADEPAYAFFSPSPFNLVDVSRQAEVKAFQKYPELGAWLWHVPEPRDGNFYADLLRKNGINQASLPFRTGAMVLCILYSLGRSGAWTSGAEELEVFEVGGGYGSLVSMAGRARRPHRGDVAHMGFRSWNIFDLEHVSALQGWYLSKTLPKNFDLERFCARGLRRRIVGSVASAPETWQLPTSPKPVVRLIATKVKDFWLFSHRSTQSGARVRVMLASFSWSECEMEEFLWYFNHILPFCEYLIFGYSIARPWEDSTIKYELITQHMVPLEQYDLSDADKIMLFRKK